ncbi:MAG TPA: glycine cleavage T C-terminal barrel domain-containing protein [Candidatus Polarisedimenticolaceae bacterium]|nr:glycine cleavage T C-terminal barrel domain-containing protein [Candidatus Polarisedimenticolaceae bacterium]
MDRGLRDRLQASGAVFDALSGEALHFGRPAAELDAALDRCALVDRGMLGRLLASGPDLLSLLNRLSTAKLDSLAVGQGVTTVVTTAKGRIVERLFVHRLADRSVLLVSGAGAAPRVVAYLDRFTFAEQTGLDDVSAKTGQLSVVGPRAAEALAAAGLPRPLPAASVVAELGGVEMHVLGQDGLSTAGYSVFLPAGVAGDAWRLLREATERCGGLPAGTSAAEAWRVLHGLPAPGHELTEDYNPLEAGLYDAVSFAKGCYVGQEVVARLNTYDKVSRSLVGLVFDRSIELPAAGTPLYHDGREAGVLTSAVTPPGRNRSIAIGYLKRRAAGAGAELFVGASESALRARVVDLPFPDAAGRRNGASRSS